MYVQIPECRSTLETIPKALSGKGVTPSLGDCSSSSFQFSIIRSRQVLACHIVATLLALAGVGLSSLTSPWLVLWLFSLLLISSLGVVKLISQSNLYFQVVRGECSLLDNPSGADDQKMAGKSHQLVNGLSYGGRRPVELERGWQLSPWLLQLRYRLRGQRRWRSLLVWPDSASSETRRLLRSHEVFALTALESAAQED